MLDQVTIRPILPDELDGVAYLRAIGFGRTKEMMLSMLHSDPRYSYSNIIVAEYEGEMIGTATVFRAQMWLSGVPVSLGAVAGVTVLPEFRRRK